MHLIAPGAELQGAILSVKRKRYQIQWTSDGDDFAQVDLDITVVVDASVDLIQIECFADFNPAKCQYWIAKIVVGSGAQTHVLKMYPSGSQSSFAGILIRVILSHSSGSHDRFSSIQP